MNLELGGTGNSWDEYWLFNVNNNKFEYNSQLSHMISARAYLREKKIETYWRSGMDCQSLENWEWEGNFLKLVDQEIINVDEEKFIHQVFKIVNGKLVRVKANNERFNIRD